jgi:hypothetical protein
MQKKDEQQFIISASDPQRLDRKHFGLYTKGTFTRSEQKQGSSD